MSYTNRLIVKTAVLIGTAASIYCLQHMNTTNTSIARKDDNGFKPQHKGFPNSIESNDNESFFETKTAAGYTIRPSYTNRVNDISSTNTKIDVE